MKMNTTLRGGKRAPGELSLPRKGSERGPIIIIDPHREGEGEGQKEGRGGWTVLHADAKKKSKSRWVNKWRKSRQGRYKF